MHMHRLPTFAILTALALTGMASRADAQNISRKLQPLGIAVGTWVYHGADMPTAGQKAGKWTWLEKCQWSGNEAFMACSFVMNGPDGVIKSLAVSTYNSTDKSYWHYEAFDSGGDGAHPFIARMTVAGDTWTYDGHSEGKTYRVTYHYESPVEVTLRIEMSADHVHWATVAMGEGHKQA
ncbi:MAG TPA: hypothetical protein VGR92_15620 [Steroidobacteraceae bacterium]|nr:hypothetical protein [Steroidobacteraceae bacterium]